VQKIWETTDCRDVTDKGANDETESNKGSEEPLHFNSSELLPSSRSQSRTWFHARIAGYNEYRSRITAFVDPVFTAPKSIAALAEDAKSDAALVSN
jgi:hypothetical protein